MLCLVLVAGVRFGKIWLQLVFVAMLKREIAHHRKPICLYENCQESLIVACTLK
jgi:hypothetical protein